MTRVLVVDDMKFMRRMIKNILVELGCTVIGEAGDGIEACEKYVQLIPDLVTLDVDMPKLGGIEALKRIRAGNPHAKVIMVSAFEEPGQIEDALRFGAIDYLRKPLDRQQMRETIQHILAASCDRPETGGGTQPRVK